VVNSWPEEIQAARIIAAWWKQIGVEAIVTPEDGGALSAIIWPDFKQDFDLWDWEQTPNLPTLLDIFMSNQIETGTSDSGMNDSSYDALYNQMVSAPTLPQVVNDANELQNIAYQQLPYINLYYLKSVQAYNTRTVTDLLLHNMSATPQVEAIGGPFNEYNWYTFLDAAPVSAVTTSSAVSSATSAAPSTGVNYTLVGVAVLVVVIVIAIVAVAMKRRTKGAT
jgi:ABC-type transport system substrate-binding protein